MRLLRRGKAAGVEGLPPEFVKEAWVEGGGGAGRECAGAAGGALV